MKKGRTVSLSNAVSMSISEQSHPPIRRSMKKFLLPPDKTVYKIRKKERRRKKRSKGEILGSNASVTDGQSATAEAEREITLRMC